MGLCNQAKLVIGTGLVVEEIHDPALLPQEAQDTQEAALAEVNQVMVTLPLVAAWQAALKRAAKPCMAGISAEGAAHSVSFLVWFIHRVHTAFYVSA